MSEQIVPVHFKGVAEAEFQAEIRAALLQLLVDASQNRGFRLDLLEGITAAVDFPKAVEDFETGYSDDRGATRETVAGRMLMAARKEGIRGHVFLPATTALDLVITESPTYGSSAYTFLHECAPVHDLPIRQSAFGEAVLDYPISPPLGDSLSVSWNEYAVCRLSPFAHPGQIGTMRTKLSQDIGNLASVPQTVRGLYQPTGEHSR
jgi:hypothetical protein